MESKEEKKSDKLYLYGLGAAVFAGYLLGSKHGYNKAVNVAKKNFIKHWKHITINGKSMHLYFPEEHELEVKCFFDNINDSLLELREIKALADKVKVKED